MQGIRVGIIFREEISAEVVALLPSWQSARMVCRRAPAISRLFLYGSAMALLTGKCFMICFVHHRLR